jgi:AbrB family looped-hinge helix DNA binding protein
MQAKVDKFGRVVIPKALRDGMGIEPGDAFQIEREGERIVLKLLEEEVQIVDKQGVMVFRCTAAGDLAAVVEEHRRERISKKISCGFGLPESHRSG